MKNRHRITAVILTLVGILALSAPAAAQPSDGQSRQGQLLHIEKELYRAQLPDLFSAELPRHLAGSEERSWEKALQKIPALAEVDRLIANEELTRQPMEAAEVDLEDAEMPLAQFEEVEEAAEEEPVQETQGKEEQKENAASDQNSDQEKEEQEESAEDKAEETTSEKPQKEEKEESGQAPESRADWEKTLPKELPDSLRKAVLAVARSQMDYEEDEKAAKKAGEDGAWTRYGAFMGDPYADPWDAEFALFSLHYAGAFDVLAKAPALPVDTNTVQWIKKLRSKDLLLSKEEYKPKAGDLVFLNVKGSKKAQAAIVTARGSDTVSVIGPSIDAKTGRVHSWNCGTNDVLAYVSVIGGDEVFANATDLTAGAYEGGEEEEEESAEEAGLREQTLTSDKVTLEGLMPEEAELSAKDVSGRKAVKALAGTDETTVAAYDITIKDGEDDYQPGEEAPIQVEIADESLREDSDITVWHLKDDGTAEEIRDFILEDGKVRFEATGFSVYAIVQGPQPFGPVIRTEGALEKLTGEGTEEGFYLSITRGTEKNYYIMKTLNGNSCFNESTNIGSACPWFFEGDESGDYRIYTMVDGQKLYMSNTGGNLMGLSETDACRFTINEAAEGTFEIKKSTESKWLQHSGGGGGLRFYTDNKNAGNCRFTMTYVSSLQVSDDPYHLDGTVWGLMNYSNGTSGEALEAQAKNTGAHQSKSLAVHINPTDRSERL